MNIIALESQVGDLLRQRGWYLATAESCTGGLIGHRLTNVPGSSDYYLGGIIAYANPVKIHTLGVSQRTIDLYGAVSRETVIEMARGARIQLSAQIGLSVSGIAGPGGASPEKPVGLTWIGLSAGDSEEARSFVFPGDRLAVKEQAAEQALQMINEYLVGILEE